MVRRWRGLGGIEFQMQSDDPDITKEELARLYLIRVGKPASRAVRSEKYREPLSSGIKFEKEKAPRIDGAKIE